MSFIRDNLLALQAALTAAGDSEVNLGSLTDTGPTYCALGLVGVTPYFQALGFYLSGEHLALLDGVLPNNATLDTYFGTLSRVRMFARRGFSPYDVALIDDDELGYPDPAVTDRALALARIGVQLTAYPT